jgi:F-type H+-transporting ATPase subunit epsilon
VPVALEIVSPAKLLLARNVDMVVIPASEGDIGVLPEHSPMIVLLRGGEVILYEGEQIADRFFVTGGFAEITGERCTVLADFVEPVTALRRADGERDLQTAMTELREAERAGDVPRAALATDRVQVAQAVVDTAQS